jgi:quercetin dioxygenase-like cupin family protein
VSRLVDLDVIRPFEVWGDEVRARKVEGERITLAIVELAPGSGVPEHRHPAEQLGICVQGEMTFTIDGETRTFGPGGTWRIPSNVPHGVVVGPHGAIAIDAFSPIRDDWDFAELEPQPTVWPGATED